MTLAGISAAAQDSVAVISGAVGDISSVDGGFTFHQPVIAPVLTLPLGSRVLIESRADLRGFISRPASGGSYDQQFFSTLEYAQAEILVNSRLTFVAGRYLTPFGIYTERVSPIWIRNFQETPIIFPIGTRSSGSSNGAQLRGAIYDNDDVSVSYAAYFSALSGVDKLDSGRAAGGRGGVFFKKPRLEIGASYQRFLQDTHYNASGAYLSSNLALCQRTSEVSSHIRQQDTDTGWKRLRESQVHRPTGFIARSWESADNSSCGKRSSREIRCRFTTLSRSMER